MTTDEYGAVTPDTMRRFAGLLTEVAEELDYVAVRLDGAKRTTAPSTVQMVEQLHQAVHGATWARPETPERVWLDLLAEVRRMRSERNPT